MIAGSSRALACVAELHRLSQAAELLLVRDACPERTARALADELAGACREWLAALGACETSTSRPGEGLYREGELLDGFGELAGRQVLGVTSGAVGVGRGGAGVVERLSVHDDSSAVRARVLDTPDATERTVEGPADRPPTSAGAPVGGGHAGGAAGVALGSEGLGQQFTTAADGHRTRGHGARGDCRCGIGDRNGDARADEQADRLSAALNDEPRGVLGVMIRELSQRLGDLLWHLERGTGVVDRRHENSSAVRARVLVTPDATDRTVEGPADRSPSSAGGPVGGDADDVRQDPGPVAGDGSTVSLTAIAKRLAEAAMSPTGGSLPLVLPDDAAGADDGQCRPAEPVAHGVAGSAEGAFGHRTLTITFTGGDVSIRDLVARIPSTKPPRRRWFL